MKKLSLILAGLLSVSLLAACGGDTTPPEESSAPESVAQESAPEATGDATAFDDVTLVVGATPAPHAEILEELVPVLAAQGINLEIKVFDDYVLPNTGLADGDLDANFFQHLPYLENYNEENDGSLVSAAGIHVEPMGIYGGKQDSLDDIAEGAQIGIPGDATNGGRALLLLESLGYITLKDGAGLEAVPEDIAENELNLQFVQLAADLLPASLSDLDYAIINGNYAVGAGLNGQALANEGAESPYVNIVAVRSGDEARPEIQALVAALQSDEIRDFITSSYDGEVVPVF